MFTYEFSLSLKKADLMCRKMGEIRLFQMVDVLRHTSFIEKQFDLIHSDENTSLYHGKTTSEKHICVEKKKKL